MDVANANGTPAKIGSIVVPASSEAKLSKLGQKEEAPAGVGLLTGTAFKEN